MTLAWILGILASSAVLFIARNAWTFRVMSRFLEQVSEKAKEDIEAGRPWEWRYETLPDYAAVLFRFWVWDERHFRPLGAIL